MDVLSLDVPRQLGLHHRYCCRYQIPEPGEPSPLVELLDDPLN